MHGRQGAVVLVLGLVAATGAGVWVMQGGNTPPQQPVLPAVAMAEPAPPLVDAFPEVWTPPQRPFDTQPAQAVIEEEVDTAPPEETTRRRRGRDDMLKRFDADGDGELNEEERALARQARRESRIAEGRQLMLRRFDTDGDGTLTDDEREIAQAEIQLMRDEICDRIVPLYDLDGDGELNDEERRAARPAYQAEYERIRIVATLDLDGSGDIDAVELVQAIVAITEGDTELDLNRDGETDYRDATYATEIAQGGS